MSYKVGDRVVVLEGAVHNYVLGRYVGEVVIVLRATEKTVSWRGLNEPDDIMGWICNLENVRPISPLEEALT